MENWGKNFIIGGIIGLVAGEMISSTTSPKFMKKAKNVLRRGSGVVNVLKNFM